MIFVKNIPLDTAEFNESSKRVDYTTQDHDIAIKFYHTTQGNEKNRGRSTKCEILAVPVGTTLTRENGRLVASAETKVFSGNFRLKPDRFDRRIGRKESLLRALAQTEFTKEEKGRIWDAYRKECKLP